MNSINTQAVILRRTDYGEADRILTLLTPDHGKLSLMAKGVRRIKSKLAGGIELFSVSDISFIKGRGEVGTLVSTRLLKHYGNIVADVNRTMLGYELIKQLHKATEDEPDEDYFDLIQQAFAALDDPALDLQLIAVWFTAQLLRLNGHTPNLQTEVNGTKLSADQVYEFNFEDSSFAARPKALYDGNDIKFLRLLFSGAEPRLLAKVTGAVDLIKKNQQIVKAMAEQYN